jgi:hypothetical protein
MALRVTFEFISKSKTMRNNQTADEELPKRYAAENNENTAKHEGTKQVKT